MSTPGEIWVRLRGLPLAGMAGVASVALAVVVLIVPAWAFVASLIGPNPPVPKTPQDPQKNAEDRAAEFARYVAQIDGRSIFHDPAAPSAPPPPVDDGPAKPPPPPSTYNGPNVIAMINNSVWFSDGKRLAVGDEAKDDLLVKAVNAPWDATVVWRGVEFKVELFARNRVVFKDAAGTTDNTPRVQAAPFDTSAPEKKKEPPKPPPPAGTDPGTPPSPPPTGTTNGPAARPGGVM